MSVVTVHKRDPEDGLRTRCRRDDVRTGAPLFPDVIPELRPDQWRWCGSCVSSSKRGRPMTRKREARLRAHAETASLNELREHGAISAEFHISQIPPWTRGGVGG